MSAAKKINLAGIILAAGQSQRLGQPKQLLEGQGRILLAHVVSSVLRAEFGQVVLVLGHLAEKIGAVLASPKGISPSQLEELTLVYNPDYATGQASSIKAGLAGLKKDIGAAMFIMGDQAGLKPELMDRMMRKALRLDRLVIIRPRFGDQFGGPVLWPRSTFGQLKKLSGDDGGRVILDRLPPEQVLQMNFPVEERPLDIDTEADYLFWLAGFESPGR